MQADQRDVWEPLDLIENQYNSRLNERGLACL